MFKIYRHPMKKILAFIMTAFFAGVACLVLPAAVSHAAVKRPMVAILPIKSQDRNYSYVGPAVTQMLDTRLSSEGIDTFVVSNSDEHSEAVGLADFLITGQVIKNENTFDAAIFLKEPEKGEILKTWHLKAVSLGVLAQDTGLLSVKLAETIKHAEDILINAPKEVQATGQEQNGSTSDEYEAARMHPDRLVREKMAQDEKKEREIEAKKTEEQKRQEREQAKAMARKKIPEVSPIIDVYDPESDELPKPVEQPADNSSIAVDDQTEISPSGPPEKSWYSKLWPFGSNKEEQKDSWEKDREKLQAQQKKKEKRVARVVPEDDLPYPPPGNVKFDIPEPVPLNQALSKISKIYTEKPAPRKEKGWQSWFWPWGEEEGASVEPERTPEKPSVQASMAPSEKMQQGMNSMIEGLSHHQQENADTAMAGGGLVQGKSEPGSEVQQGMNSMVEGLSGKDQDSEAASLGTTEAPPKQRQEHVYFGPRIDTTEEDAVKEESGEPEGPPTVENPSGADEEMEKDLQARTETQSLPETASIETATPPQPETVSPAGTLETFQPETGNESSQSDVTSEDQEQENRSKAGETDRNGNPGESDGPIWRWY